MQPPSNKRKADSQLSGPATKRAYRVRRAKQVNVIDIGLNRGSRNNGLIEIENEPSEDESDIEREISGNVYRVTEKGIKLDFIERVNQ